MRHHLYRLSLLAALLLPILASAQNFTIDGLATDTPTAGDKGILDEGGGVYKAWDIQGFVASGGAWTAHTSGATLVVNTDNAYDADNGAATFTLPAAGTAGDRIILRIWQTGTPAAVTLEDSGSTVVWIGTSGGDYVELRDNGAAWQVVGHRETIYLKIYVNADESVAAGTSEQVVNLTAGTDTASLFDGTGNEVDLPALASRIRLDWHVLTESGVTKDPLIAEAKLDTAYVRTGAPVSTNTAPVGGYPSLSGLFDAAASQSLELWARNIDSDNAVNVAGDAAGNESLATISITWAY